MFNCFWTMLTLPGEKENTGSQYIGKRPASWLPCKTGCLITYVQSTLESSQKRRGKSGILTSPLLSDRLGYQQITVYKFNVGFNKLQWILSTSPSIFHEETETVSIAGTGRASPVFLGKHPFRKSYQFSPGGCEITTVKAREEDNSSYIQVNLIRRPY